MSHFIGLNRDPNPLVFLIIIFVLLSQARKSTEVLVSDLKFPVDDKFYGDNRAIALLKKAVEKINK